ncbi:hypothetical protein NPX13_g4645 [Xylaria arbuscula]|uniref:Uncharacterized protein n=1 Tax=Xylaria arbuscula TaxID=114810 RepID=A0A9W8NF40_9PEZI|nr:hypothetical protein NPX13_g4645 [Xylaria arbuscula]
MLAIAPCQTRGWIAHSTPEVKRLTPDRTTDRCETNNELPNSRVAQRVAGLLRLLVALTELLKRSLSDQHRLKNLLKKLDRCCDDLCTLSQDTPLMKSGSKLEKDVGTLSDHSYEVQGVESDIIATRSNHQPKDELENVNTPSPIEFEESTSDSDTISAYRQNDFIGHSFINPTMTSSETKDPAAKPAPVRKTIERPSSSDNLPVTQLRTPVKTPSIRYSRTTPEVNTAVGCDQPIELMIKQSAPEFARSSLEEIEQLEFPMDSAETYKDLLNSLSTAHPMALRPDRSSNLVVSYSGGAGSIEQNPRPRTRRRK